MASAPNHEALDRPFIHPDDMPDLHALRGHGTCMEPEIADGTLLVIDKREIPEPGDVVSIIFTREAAKRWKLPGLVKKLAFSLPPPELDGSGMVGLIVADQLNPPRRYAIPTSDVLAVYKCVGIGEATGTGTARLQRSLGN